jgi:hypothetical protein
VATHREAWRDETLRQLEWIDDLAKRLNDEELRLALKRSRDDTSLWCGFPSLALTKP